MVLKELPEFAVKQNCKISLGESMCKQFKEVNFVVVRNVSISMQLGV